MKALRACGLYIAFTITLLPIYAHAGWTPPVRISDERASYGPRIVANGNTLHVVYWSRPAGTNLAFYLRSNDRGGAWNEPFLLPDTTHMSNCGVPIIRFEDNNLAVIWRGDIRGGGTRLNYGFRLSADNGMNWNDIEYVLPDDQTMLQKHTFCISASKLFFIYSYWSQEIIVNFTRSTNWGESWTEPAEVFRTQETGRFDMAARGDTIHVVWPGRYDYSYNVWETYYIKSENAGADWTENLLLTAFDERGSMWPSISINERGDIVVCWIDFKYSPYWWTGDLFVRYSYDAGESWTEEEQIMFTHTAASPRILWKGDSLHIVWEDNRYGGPDPFYRVSHDNGLTWGEEQRIDDDPVMSHTPDLAVFDDNVHVVWDDRRPYDPGRGIYYSRWEEEVGVDHDGHKRMPEGLNLTAYPNPFNSSAIITYRDLEGGEIEIYSIMGQKIRTLIVKPKEGKVIWDARDALGNKVSSGIYFARAKTSQNTNTIKLLYLR